MSNGNETEQSLNWSPRRFVGIGVSSRNDLLVFPFPLIPSALGMHRVPLGGVHQQQQEAAPEVAGCNLMIDFFSSYSSYYISTPFIYNDWQSNTHWELCKKPPFSISLAFKLSDETFAGTFSFRCYLIFISHCFRLWPIASHRRLHTFTTIMESHFIWYV